MWLHTDTFENVKHIWAPARGSDVNSLCAAWVSGLVEADAGQGKFLSEGGAKPCTKIRRGSSSEECRENSTHARVKGKVC